MEAALNREELLALPNEEFRIRWHTLSDDERLGIGAAGFRRMSDILSNGHGASGPELLALSDEAFWAVWRGLAEADIAAIPEPLRGQLIQRFREATSYVDDTNKRLTRDQAAAEATAKAKPTPKTPEAPRFPRVWLDDAAVNLASYDYVKGIIGPRMLALIYGPSGDGKTFFSIDLLAHVATGREWRGRRVRPCLCVYIAAEAGVSVLRRFVAWRDRSLSEARETLTPLAIITRAANLLHAGDVEALVTELNAISAEADLPVGIVVFDTFSRSTPGGDENAARDVTLAVAVADRLRDELGASTAFVHHSGKDAAKGARGHSSLFAAADTVIAVIERVATIEKARDGIVGQQFAFQLEVVDLGRDTDGDAITTCIVVPTEATAATAKVKPLTGVGAIALLALTEALAAHGELVAQTSTIPHGVRAVHFKHVRERFAIRYGKDGATEREPDSVTRAFSRGKLALLNHGLIGISDPYVWRWP